MIRFLIFVTLTFSLDRVLKLWVEQKIGYLSFLEFNNPIFDVFYVQNKGVAFSLLENNPIFIKLLSFCFLSYGLYYIFVNSLKLNPTYKVFLGILIGGVLGNLYDRMAYGYVIDYIQLKFIEFPIMNFADIAINLGIIGVIILIFTGKEFKDAK